MNPKPSRRVYARSRPQLAIVVIALALGVSSGAPAARADTGPVSARDDSVTTILRDVAQRGVLSGIRWPRFPYFRAELETLYTRAGWRPIWTDGGRPTGSARAAIEVLESAKERGLQPEDYDASALERRFRELAESRTPSARDIAWFDLALSIGMARHLTDLNLGRVDPKNISVGINVDAKRLDRARIVRWIADHGHLHEVVRDLEPQFLQYRNLKSALAHYRVLAARTDLPEVPVPAKSVRTGETFEGATALRRRLAAIGYLPAYDTRWPRGADSTFYDEGTAEAIKKFQERRGLDPDGVLGPTTVTSINVSYSRRVRQLELAMERIRWLPAFQSGPFVIVNIPSFQLYAFDTLRSTGIPDMSMNVVVGKDQVGRRTPIFERDMRYLVFRPYWVITRNILRNEILPAVRRNPGYLKKNSMEIYSGSGDSGPTLPTTSANLARVSRGELGIRERPGPKNSLGLAKFIFPNDDNVYMHGTPATQLFSRSRRDFSHGCIRLEDPPKMAVWVLRDPVKWPLKEVQTAMNEGKDSRRVSLTKPLPVVIYYSTAVAYPDGLVGFFDDIYRHDVALEEALAKGYPYPR